MGKIAMIVLCLTGLLFGSSADGQLPDSTKTFKQPKDATDSSRFNKQLKEVVVTGQKSRFIEYQLDKTVINPNALISAAGGSTLDILNTAPGVFVDMNGSISLKGKENVFIYIDDKPSHLMGNDLISYLRSLPVSMIDKIELMSSPSSRYNADGAAIINIRTKKIRSRGFNASLTLNVGYTRYLKSFNSMLVNYRNKFITVYFNGGFAANNTFFHSHRERTYNYSSSLPSFKLLQDVSETSHSNSNNFNLGIDYYLSKNTTVGFQINGYAEPYHERGIYINNFTSYSGKPDSFIVSDSRFNKVSSRKGTSLNIQHFFTRSNKELNIYLDYLHYSTSGNQYLEGNFYLPPDSLVKQYLLISKNPFEAAIYGAKASYSDTIFHSIKWEQGFQTTQSIRNNTSEFLDQSGNSDNGTNNKFRYSENISAAYINFQRNFKRLSAQTGLRLENTIGDVLQYAMPSKPDTSFRLGYTNLFPTIYLMYKLDSIGENTILLSAGKRIERPGYTDLNPASFYFDKNTVNAGNSLLQPAFSKNLELTFSHNNKFSAGLNMSRTKGIITRGYRQLADAFISTTINVDQFTTLGTSLSLSFNFTPWWTLTIDQQFIRRHYKGEIFNTGMQINNNLTTFYLKTYSQFRFRDGWSADLTTTYRSKLLLWQSYQRPIGQIVAGIKKKFNEKAMVTISGTDIFHTYKTNRYIDIQYAQIYYHLVFDTQQISLTFNYRFGKSLKIKERKTGIETEAGRL
jgi:iron complex outermembrane receptor protein